MKHIAAEIAVPACTFSGRTTRADTVEVRVSSSIASSATRAIVIRIEPAERVRARIDELDLAADVIRTVITGPGQRAVAAVQDVERQAALE